MDIQPLNEGLAIAPQVRPGDMAAIARAGYRAIIANRPDGEEQAQPTAAAVEAAARAAGLGFAHVPVISGAIGDADVAAMRQALERLPRPILAYCRSGARSAKLAELAGAVGSAPGQSASFDILIVGGGAPARAL